MNDNEVLLASTNPPFIDTVRKQIDLAVINKIKKEPDGIEDESLTIELPGHYGAHLWPMIGELAALGEATRWGLKCQLVGARYEPRKGTTNMNFTLTESNTLCC